jgi:hypothetical protein
LALTVGEGLGLAVGVGVPVGVGVGDGVVVGVADEDGDGVGVAAEADGDELGAGDAVADWTIATTEAVLAGWLAGDTAPQAIHAITAPVVAAAAATKVRPLTSANTRPPCPANRLYRDDPANRSLSGMKRILSSIPTFHPQLRPAPT